MQLNATQTAIDVAIAAARAAINEYSSFDSSMVPDDALAEVVTTAFNAGLEQLAKDLSGSTTGETS